MKTFFYVAPRYTAGPPEEVDGVTAVRVGKEELEAYLNLRRFGSVLSKDFIEAERLGLEGISYSSTAMVGDVLVEDLITKSRFRVPSRVWPEPKWYLRTNTDRRQYLRFRGRWNHKTEQYDDPATPATTR